MSTRVLLRVGEREFHTSKETLSSGSIYFHDLFHGVWQEKDTDGFYFVDADGNAFEHILRYLRHGLFPVIYDKTNGHNFVMYGVIMEEAKMLGIDALINWLKVEGYFRVMNKETYQVNRKPKDTYRRRSSVQDLHPSLDGKNVSVMPVWYCFKHCPEHINNKSLCNKECRPLDNEGISTSGRTGYELTQPVFHDGGVVTREAYYHSACVDDSERNEIYYRKKTFPYPCHVILSPPKAFD